ncbi:hypothetical protein Cmtc_39830 [Cupriavidus sp. TKC]|nr:hypothetical protein Cmtc_39830 [Cupriavidus sp. TKC]
MSKPLGNAAERYLDFAFEALNRDRTGDRVLWQALARQHDEPGNFEVGGLEQRAARRLRQVRAERQDARGLARRKMGQ